MARHACVLKAFEYGREQFCGKISSLCTQNLLHINMQARAGEQRLVQESLFE